MAWQTLTSEKYWLESVKKEQELLKKQKQSRFRNTLLLLGSAAVAIIGTVYATLF